MSGFEDTPLGKWAEQQANEKPKTETIERDFLNIFIDRRSADGVISVIMQGNSEPTVFSVEDSEIISGHVEHSGVDIDKKLDNSLLTAHAKTLKTLIEEGKI
ncbi:hypothetical protein KC723_01860 [Candidatus Kaiserbacteria bacterium]|nr:hypothetical protein [Candidatus Kaiserbacteria bacterium]